MTLYEIAYVALYDWIPPSPATTNKTYDGLNRDATIAAIGTQPCAASGSGYDCNGNLTNDGTRVFTYDAENRLLSASAPTAVTLSYDPLGRLWQTTAGGVVTQYLYSGQNLMAEYDGSGNVLRRYVQGPGTDDPQIWAEGSTWAAPHYLHKDAQGSVIAWSDASGDVTPSQIYSYGAYGEPQTWGGSRFRYTGQIEIPEARLYYYKARVYDPVAGRFMQTDPIGGKDDLDLYAYVKEDPVDHSDPSGEAEPLTPPDGFCHCGIYGGGPQQKSKGAKTKVPASYNVMISHAPSDNHAPGLTGMVGLAGSATGGPLTGGGSGGGLVDNSGSAGTYTSVGGGGTVPFRGLSGMLGMQFTVENGTIHDAAGPFKIGGFTTGDGLAVSVETVHGFAADKRHIVDGVAVTVGIGGGDSLQSTIMNTNVNTGDLKPSQAYQTCRPMSGMGC